MSTRLKPSPRARVRATLSRDPWSGSHLVVDAIELWTIRLDGRGPGET